MTQRDYIEVNARTQAQMQRKELLIMSSNTSISIRLNKKVKEEASKVLISLGMTTSAAVNILLRQIIIADKKFPFVPTVKGRKR